MIVAGGIEQPVSLTKSEVLQAFAQQSDTWKGYAAAKNTDSRKLFAAVFGQDCAGVTTKQGEDTLTAACPHTAGTLCYMTYAAVRQDAQPNDAETVFVNWLATEKGIAWLHEAIQGTLTQETQMPDAS